MRISLLIVTIMVVCFSSAHANLPEPDMCFVEPCDAYMGVILYPQPDAGGAAEMTIHVRNTLGDPIPNVFVELIFGTPGNHFVCDDAVLTGVTDHNGEVVMSISAGGCTIGQDALLISGNGVIFRSYQNAKSPDYNPTNGEVNLGDFIWFGNNLMTAAPGCTDYYNTGSTSLASFIVFGEAWTHSCP